MEDCWMAKKSNKTAHVLSLLTNGQGTLDDEVIAAAEKPSKQETTKDEVSEEQQPIVDEQPADDIYTNEVSQVESVYENPAPQEQPTPVQVQHEEYEPVPQPAPQPTAQAVPQQAPPQIESTNQNMTPQAAYDQQYQHQAPQPASYEQSYQQQIPPAASYEQPYQPQMPQASYETQTLHPQAVPFPASTGFSKTAQMAQFANYESQIMTQNEISAIPNLMHAMPVQKPEVVVQMQSSDESVALADLVKADLEKALEKQIQERLEADANQKNYDESDRPPYSATFLAKFGENLKQVQKAREAVKHEDPLSSELKLALEQSLEQDLEQSISDSLAFELQMDDCESSIPPTREVYVDPFALSILDELEEDKEPTYESVKKEAYVWENFDDEDDEDDEKIENTVNEALQTTGFVDKEQTKEVPFEHEVLKSAEDFLNPHFSDSTDTKEDTMGTEYTAINSPSSKDEEDAKKVVIRNLAEELVKAKAPGIMASMNMCTCPACVLDVVAFTLNHTQPLYVSTEKGQLFSKLASCDLQYGTDIASEITKACLKIKLNPRHPAVE